MQFLNTYNYVSEVHSYIYMCIYVQGVRIRGPPPRGAGRLQIHMYLCGPIQGSLHRPGKSGAAQWVHQVGPAHWVGKIWLPVCLLTALTSCWLTTASLGVSYGIGSSVTLLYMCCMQCGITYAFMYVRSTNAGVYK